MPYEVDLARLERWIGDPGDVDNLEPAAVRIMAPAGGVSGIGQQPDLAE
jgi:hypothetical protein